MPVIMPSEVLNLGVFQRLRPPLLVVAYGEHSANRSRVIPPRSPTKFQVPQTLGGSDNIVNHVHETALAVPGFPQGDDALVEVHVSPLEAICSPFRIPVPKATSSSQRRCRTRGS